MERPPNPPAFPTQTVVDGNQNIHWGSNGMTMRDYFAAAALQGILANPDLQKHFRKDFKGNIHDFNASIAYQAADSMLAEGVK